MTSISSVNNAALLILWQTSAASAASRADAGKSAADNIAAIVNGISDEASRARTQASSVINSTLLDMKETDDDLISGALALLDSDSFQSSDPNVANVIKKLISDDGDKFASLVKMEKAKSPGISDDNAIANAIQSLIRSNRSSFGDEEFVIGIKLSSGGAIISNIEDINGNSTINRLNANVDASRATLINAAKLLNGADGSDPDVLKAASAGLTNNGLIKALDDVAQWMIHWKDTFCF